MKLKDLKQFLSLIKDDDIDVCVQVGDNIKYLDILKINRGDLVLSNKEYEQRDTEQQNMSVIFKLNSKFQLTSNENNQTKKTHDN